MHVCARGLLLQHVGVRVPAGQKNVFASGNDGNLFEIDPNTGNVSMQKEADTLETITLTVLVNTLPPPPPSSSHIETYPGHSECSEYCVSFLQQASQKSNSFQATSTSVTITVLTESLHPPQFQSPRYQGTVAGVGNMALDMKNEPLHFLATDADYAATGVTQKPGSRSQHPHHPADLLFLFSKSLNPNIIYYVSGRSEFSIVGGYLFMTKNLPEATLNLQVRSRLTGLDVPAR